MIAVPILIVALVAGSALWVYRDAGARAAVGDPVFFAFGSLEIESPAVWAAGCLCLWVLFMPLYLVCRKPAR